MNNNKVMFPHELIGKKITIIESTNKTEVGISGEVVDETKETFTVITENGEKMLFKKNIVFTLNSERVEGKSIRKRPEERIKGK